MTTLVETNQRGGYISSEANKTLSRDTVTLITGQNLKVGTVLGTITATGKFTILAPAAADGSQTASAILFDDVDATTADKKCTVTARNSEVQATELIYPVGITAPQKTAALAALAAKNIVAR